MLNMYKVLTGSISPQSIGEEIIKIVCISDTHGLHNRMPTLPLGDVLIHAGDFSNTGEPAMIADFMAWMHRQRHPVKVIIAGNHDLTIHEEFYESEGRKRFHAFARKKVLYDPKECKKYLTMYSDVIYLEDSEVTLTIPSKNVSGEFHKLRVYGSPWQPEFCDWAFNLPRGEELLKKWRLIPENIDILITHGPPQGYGDRCRDGFRAGCSDLLSEIVNRIHPRVHIFGHIHENEGVWMQQERPSDTAEDAANNSGDNIQQPQQLTMFVNASTCDLRYNPCHLPIVVCLPVNKSLNPYI